MISIPGPPMRIAFYAPMKAPNHPVPSGDRGMARLLMAALSSDGHDVRLASTLRSWDDGRRPGRAARLAALGTRCAARLTARWRDAPPALWFTYHVYHKAPDWIGPAVCDALGIPYVIAEASHAPKQADGPFARGHAAAAAAIRRADAVVNLASHDADGVRRILGRPDRLITLRPFIHTAPLAAAADRRAQHRKALADRLDIPADVPWLLAVGMMRTGDKRRSYTLLAEALRRLTDRPWRLIVVGDGATRSAIEADFAAAVPGRTRFTGTLDAADIAGVCAAADLMTWPAINEAYGMALLEAQAAGVPVVAGRTGGVPDIVRDGVTGLVPPVGDVDAFAAAVAALLDDPARRARYAEAARRVAGHEHDLATAAATLGGLITRLTAPAGGGAR